MRQLLPTRADVADLESVYAYPDGGWRDGRPWLRANMVSSADGSTTSGGRSGALGGPADRELFGLMRGLADVILVGAGTARTEGYRPPRAKPSYAESRARSHQLPAPALAVVSRHLRFDPEEPLFAEPAAAPLFVVTCAAAPADRQAALRDRAELIVAGENHVDLAAAVDALAARGLRRMLCEGGPTLLARVVEAGLLDELCLTISPTLVAGGGPRVLSGPELDPMRQLRLTHLVEDDGFLFARYLVG
jgi:riboflavin biosynthesis pyrimidine reductase